ncbi:hypothetical protein ABZ924_16860 [Streptomyces sp. NPDC046876]|uniref:hypothetical protein n=1 Tax=Streptomyces sp. NPDC046876 TaxID=3155616 RepID=UPI003403E06D
MVETTYKQYWDIPGGYVETGESPLQRCQARSRRGARHHSSPRPLAGRGLGPEPRRR